jgi:hypothetical protein
MFNSHRGTSNPNHHRRFDPVEVLEDGVSPGTKIDRVIANKNRTGAGIHIRWNIIEVDLIPASQLMRLVRPILDITLHPITGDPIALISERKEFHMNWDVIPVPKKDELLAVGITSMSIPLINTVFTRRPITVI